MKKMLLVILVFILFLCAGFLYIEGSEWIFAPGKNTPIYARDDTDISTSTALAVALDGEKLQVVKCFFDKSDASVVVRSDDGVVGFIFDYNQHFIRSWSFSSVQLDQRDFSKKLTCWNLISQFGK